MKTLSDSYKAFRETAIYPGSKTPLGVTYCLTGLVEEAGEVYEAFDFLAKNRLKVIKEIGDCWWYFQALCYELSIPPMELSEKQNLDSLVYERYSYDMLPEVTFYVLLSELAGHVKKFIRNDEGVLTPSRREAFVNTLRKVLIHIIFLCKEAETTFGNMVQINYQKLKKRKEQGTLKERSSK